MRNLPVTFLWKPAHIGIKGNEITAFRDKWRRNEVCRGVKRIQDFDLDTLLTKQANTIGYSRQM